MGDSSSSASYIRMVCVLYHFYIRYGLTDASNDDRPGCFAAVFQVHHLIEKCICFNLNKEECMDALEKHAKINPVITSTGTAQPSYIPYHMRML